MKSPLQSAMHAACCWLKRRPGMKADPSILLEFVSAWLAVAAQDGPMTETEARKIGVYAVKECAGCVREIPQQAWIEPEDLRD